MSEALLNRIEHTSHNFSKTNDSDNIAPQDAVIVLSAHAKNYANAEGARDGVYHDGRDNYLRSMVDVARETFGYRYKYEGRGLDLKARHFMYNMARVSFLAEMASHAGTFDILQEKVDIKALRRLLDGHYDDYLKEDKVPLPFEWMKEHRS